VISVTDQSPQLPVPSRRRPIAALLSPCGTGNLGDAAIQDSLMHHVRKLSPEAAFVGITLSPIDTESRHRIPGFPIDIFRRGMPFGAVPTMLQDADLSPFPPAFQKVRARAHAMTIGAEHVTDVRASRLRRVARRLKAEVRHFLLALELCRFVDVLVISGGGQIDDLWGGAGQHPFALFKWTLAAKICRRPILVVSVGSGRLRSSQSRWLVRRTLSRAGSATCRDRHSARVVGALRGKRVDVVPDMALAYPVAKHSGPEPYNPRAGDRLRVGIAPMAFGDKRFWPEDKAKQFRHYIESLAEMARRQVRDGATITLFSTTPADAQVAKELHEVLHATLPAEMRQNLILKFPKSVESLIEALESIDVLVASRLHALILATVCLRPMVAIACEWKVERHLSELGMSQYCHRFTDVGPDELYEGVCSLAAEHAKFSAQTREFREHAEAKLGPQYRMIARVLDGGGVAAMGVVQAP
jgi:polysaccharide pyruvyl transferase WcaK-like protein